MSHAIDLKLFMNSEDQFVNQPQTGGTRPSKEIPAAEASDRREMSLMSRRGRDGEGPSPPGQSSAIGPKVAGEIVDADSDQN